MKISGIKKKILIIVFIFTAIILTAPLCRTNIYTSAAELSDNAVIALSGEIDDENVSVDAVLIQNTGLNGLTVEISYDTNIMTLTNVTRGSGLSSLDYITTNVETEKGFGIIPFKINWSGDKNDESTGLLFNMSFSVKENVRDGKYFLTLKTERDQSATYIAGDDIATKNVLINGVQVEIIGSKPKAVEEVISQGEVNVLLWVSLSVAAVAVISLIVVIILKIKGKRSWTKIE